MKDAQSPLTPPGPLVGGFDRLSTIVRQLRSPQGCPWDRKQTPQSLRTAMIEEAYETVEAINDGDTAHVREELGDVYLLITMIGAIYEDEKGFTLDEVLHEVSEKLIRRHPHVYGDAAADTPEAVAKQWDSIKQHVEGRKKDSVLDTVSHALPPLERAFRMQKKAAKNGFDWSQAEPVWDKIHEELAETREAWEAREAEQDRPHPQPSQSSQSHEHLEEELGDLLFSVVNVARYLKLDPAIALQRSNTKFERRFRYVEREMTAREQAMGPDSFEAMDALWNEAKTKE